MKKLISVVLVVIMLLSLSVAAFADGAEMKYKSYEKYLNIGDSVARGCGIPGHQGVTYRNDEWNNANGGCAYPGSYPAILTDTLNPDTAHHFHYMGIRTQETYYALGGDIDPWTYDNYAEIHFGEHFSGPGGIDNVMDDLQAAAATSGLITLEVGSNDVFYSALSRSGLEKAAESGDTDAILSVVGDYLKYSAEGYEGFCEYYPKIVERIFELQAAAGRSSKDFDLVLVGVFNPFSNAPITDDIFLPVMEVTGVLTGSMNAFLKELANKYDNVYFADVTDVQTPVTSGSISVIASFANGNSTVNTHPTAEGYKYIARQILNVLPQEKVYPKTYIQLNLPTNFTVSKVLLGDKSVSFTQDGYNLIVPNMSKTRNTMTVSGTDESGNSLIFFYQLAYHSDTGYTSYRIASTNNFVQSLTRVVNSVKTVVTGIVGLLKK